MPADYTLSSIGGLGEQLIDGPDGALSPLRPSAADVDEARAERDERVAEQSVHRVPHVRSVALRSVGDPRNVGMEEKIEIRQPLAGCPLDPARAVPVVVTAVDDRAHEVRV